MAVTPGNSRSRDGGPPGHWAGKGAEQLGLHRPVTQTEFDAALRGIDPKTDERLTQLSGREHAVGWDMTADILALAARSPVATSPSVMNCATLTEDAGGNL
jgi:hypothetical protein